MELPPDQTLRAVVQRYAKLVSVLGEEIGQRPLVLPTAEFFPDTFRGDTKSVARLVKRMRAHAGLGDVPMRVQVLGADGEPVAAGGCGTGSCGTGSCATPTATGDTPRLVEDDGRWVLNVPEAEVGNPVVLTASVARALATVFLLETLEEGGRIADPAELTTDLAGVALGFGVVLLEGSYIYSKSCGGPSVSRVTALGPAELGVAVALFTAAGDHDARAAAKHLGTTPASAFAEARSWLASNQHITGLLGSDPERLAGGDFEIHESRPWLLRVFGKKKRSADPLDLDALEAQLVAAPVPRQNKATKPDPRRDELKALVDEALAESRADAE
jgi:hypothetical protein